MLKKHKTIKTGALIFAALFVLQTTAVPAYAADADAEVINSVSDASAADGRAKDEQNGTAGSGDAAGFDAGLSYLEFSEAYPDAEKPVAEIPVISGNTVVFEAGSSYEYTVNAEKAGLYAVSMTYVCREGIGAAPAFSLYINGELPFDEAQSMHLVRRWKDEKPLDDETVKSGRIPNQTEVYEPQTVILSDNVYFYGGRLYFPLEIGENRIRIQMENETIEVSELKFVNEPDAPSYEEASAGYKYKDYSGEPLYFEAEYAAYKSDATLYAVNDSTSATTSPTSAYEKYLNTIGGGSWDTPGQYIEWEFEVPEDGLYEMAFKYRQNINAGMSSYRRIIIDGELLFSELDEVDFAYSSGFSNRVLGGDEPYKIELSKGKHTVRLEVIVGELSEVLPLVENCVKELNDAYRKIIMITGSNPDTLRDYQLETAVPDVIETFKEQQAELERLSDYIEETMDGGSAGTKNMGTLAAELAEFVEDPYRITGELARFKSNITALSTWMISAKSQPLQLDYFCLYAPGGEIKKAKAGFFSMLEFELKSLLFTFSDEYQTNPAAEGADTITVWTTAGQTQLSILQQLVEDDFYTDHDITVDVKLVTSSLLMAIVAGKAPDIALNVASADAMNYAFRNAVVDLNQYDDIDEVTSQFRESALAPITYKDSLYGLPLTQSYHMLFYRKDIIDELGISIPETWDDVIIAMATLKKNNLEFGIPIPTDLQTYYSMLYQNGGTLYNEDMSATALTSYEAISAFTRWSEFFTDYQSPKQFDAQNRFRTGEIPILINDFSLYCTLSVLAPEIEGLWGIAMMPGTVKEDGSVDHTAASTDTCSIILKNNHEDACWEFLKWWSGEDAQYKYATRVEMALGQSARVMTANVAAFERLPWDADTLSMLKKQAEELVGVPQVPGGYYTSRYIGNALNKVMYDSAVPGEILMDFSETIDSEIASKRKELGLDE